MDKEQTTTTAMTEQEAIQFLVYRHALEGFYFRMHDDSAGELDDNAELEMLLEAIYGVTCTDPSIARFFYDTANMIMDVITTHGLMDN